MDAKAVAATVIQFWSFLEAIPRITLDKQPDRAPARDCKADSGHECTLTNNHSACIALSLESKPQLIQTTAFEHEGANQG